MTKDQNPPAQTEPAPESSAPDLEGESAAGAPRRLFPALRNRPFAIYASGGMLSFMALWTQRTAIGWLIWDLTASGTWLGLIAFVSLVPIVILGPVGGVLADRHNPVSVSIITHCFSAVISGLLLAVMYLGLMTPVILVVFAAIQGVVGSFSQTAQLAAVPSLLDRKELPSGVAIISVTFNVARFTGPAVAGILIAGPGTFAAFAVSTVGFAAFLIALFIVRRAARALERSAKEGFFKALGDGVRYTFGHAGVAPIMITAILVGATGRPVIELLPGFAAGVFEAGPMGLAALTSSIGVGAILAGLRRSTTSASTAQLTRSILNSVLAMSAAIAAFSMAPNIFVAIPLVVFTGFLTANTGISTQTLLNIAVADTMRGRVLSLYGVFFRGSPAIGALAIGAISDFLGLRLSLLIGSACLVLCWLWFRPRERNLAQALDAPRDEAKA